MDRAFMQRLDWDKALSLLKSKSFRACMSTFADLNFDYDDQTLRDWHPFTLAAKAMSMDEDTPTFEEATNGPYADEFWNAMDQELETLESMKVWDVVKREPWMNVLPSTWALRIKRNPDGSVRKYKARFCARGDRQIAGVDFFETFAPVVNWTTVRLLMIIASILDLKLAQVDYTAAFVHAPIDRDPNWDNLTPEEQRRSGVYVEMPRGYGKPGQVYKLKKSLYGLKQSPRNFFNYSAAQLEAVGLKSQTDVDPCLFIGDGILCVVYVDDCYFAAKSMDLIDQTIEKIRARGITLEKEPDSAGFLGVKIQRDEAAGTVTFTQAGLIQRIVKTLGVTHGASTPAKCVLHKDEHGDPPQGTYSYSSVIGMMWYLYAHSRPEIGFALSQASRFAQNPKRSHEEALERIGQYLLKTADKGLIIKPHKDNLNIDAYVDADFCGLYGSEKRSDPTSVKSRTGYVICVAGCPLVWASKLQNEVTLSTMMAEYYALATAMKEVIPLRRLLQVMAGGAGLPEDMITTFKTTVWEDNAGALILANLDPGQTTPRSKFYDLKVHWFRSHLKPNSITVEKIDTKEQKADIFTKNLNQEVFERLRLLLCGW
jgi:hypothetical protein